MAARDCIVLGCARNGTSIVSGMISTGGGHRPGPDVWPPNSWNETGYFESRTVNDLNDRLLAPHVSATTCRVPAGAGWLKALPAAPSLRWEPAPTGLDQAMAGLTRVHPFCLKDPRFCYTLPAWAAHLHGALRVCVFRDPASAVPSLIGFAAQIAGVTVTAADACDVWRRAYLSVLAQADCGDWIFVSHSTLTRAQSLARIEDAIGSPVTRELVSSGRRARTQASIAVPADLRELHAQLLARAI